MSDPDLLSKTFRSSQGREFQVTYCRIRGKSPGPTLTLIAGQHGAEHIGPVMLTQFVDEIAPEDFRGTLYICPCANPLALEIDYEFYPEREDLSKLKDYYYSRDRHGYCIFNMGRHQGPNYYNMNRLWQREGDYGVAGEITRWLWSEIIERANVVMDFHCLQAKKPLIYSASSASNAVARYFGVQAIYMMAPNPDDFRRCNLERQNAPEGGRRCFCVEFSCQHLLKEEEFPLGKQGIRNVMKGIGMMTGDVILDKPVYIVEVGSLTDLSTEVVGHIHFCLDEYDPAQKGDVLFEIRSLETLELLDRVVSPVTGIMGRRTHKAVSEPGLTVCSVAEVSVLAEAGEPLAKLQGFWGRVHAGPGAAK